MKRILLVVLFLFTTISVAPVYGQEDEEEAARNQTRGQMAKLLDKVGPLMNVVFSQSPKDPYDFVGTLKTGLVNAERFEIAISVTPKDTIGFRIYPRYKNANINVDRVNDRAAFMRLLLRLSDRTFLFWGAGETGDVFAGYTFTLESGFPEEAINIVLRSIVNSDKFVAEMRPLLDEPIELISPLPTKPAPAKKQTPTRRRRG